jgi:two-component system, OmpR family, sensor histidine kinase VicK
VKLTTSAREEMLTLFSTANVLYRTSKWLDVDLIKELVHKYGTKVRVLTPFSDWVKQQVQEWGEFADIRYIPEELQTQITIGIYDRKFSLVAEIKDDSKNSSYEAMGLVTYSNSPSTISSYVSIFETLWKQSGMYQESQNQLHSAEAELDRMKQYLNEVLEEVASFKKTVER